MNKFLIKEPQCAICLESSGEIVMSQCGHFSHETCLMKWFKLQSSQGTLCSCPLCRTKVIFFVDTHCPDCENSAEDLSNPIVIRIETQNEATTPNKRYSTNRLNSSKLS